MVVGGLIGKVSVMKDGLMPKDGFINRDVFIGDKNPDSFTESGLYVIQQNNITPFKFGGLIVYNFGLFVVQIMFQHVGNVWKYRTNWNKEGWSLWV